MVDALPFGLSAGELNEPRIQLEAHSFDAIFFRCLDHHPAIAATDAENAVSFLNIGKLQHAVDDFNRGWDIRYLLVVLSEEPRTDEEQGKADDQLIGCYHG